LQELAQVEAERNTPQRRGLEVAPVAATTPAVAVAGHSADTRDARTLAAVREWMDTTHDALPERMGRRYVQGLLLQLESLLEETP
jgi:hypothetical protein